MVIDRNKPDAEVRKDVLKVIAGFNIISRKPGKVFHNDAGNITGAHHRHHALKTGTVEIRPGISVIDELDRLHRSKLRLLLNELSDDTSLSRDTVAFIVRTGVLKRQPEIHGNMIFLHSGNLLSDSLALPEHFLKLRHIFEPDIQRAVGVKSDLIDHCFNHFFGHRFCFIIT